MLPPQPTKIVNHVSKTDLTPVDNGTLANPIDIALNRCAIMLARLKSEDGSNSGSQKSAFVYT